VEKSFWRREWVGQELNSGLSKHGLFDLQKGDVK
jgi:hypothetical protein